jgi:hypothetical protein
LEEKDKKKKDEGKGGRRELWSKEWWKLRDEEIENNAENAKNSGVGEEEEPRGRKVKQEDGVQAEEYEDVSTRR